MFAAAHKAKYTVQVMRQSIVAYVIVLRETSTATLNVWKQMLQAIKKENILYSVPSEYSVGGIARGVQVLRCK